VHFVRARQGAAGVGPGQCHSAQRQRLPQRRHPGGAIAEACGGGGGVQPLQPGQTRGRRKASVRQVLIKPQRQRHELAAARQCLQNIMYVLVSISGGHPPHNCC